MHKPSQVEKYERNLKSGCSSIYAWEGLGKLSGWESSKAESPIAAARGQRLAAASWGWGGAFIAICSGKAMETREVRWEVRLRGEENHFFQKKAYPEGHLLQEWHSKRPCWLGADISACWRCFAALEWCMQFLLGKLKSVCGCSVSYLLCECSEMNFWATVGVQRAVPTPCISTEESLLQRGEWCSSRWKR